jgi:hypothetical protein
MEPVLSYTEKNDEGTRDNLKFTIDETGRKRVSFPAGQTLRRNLPMSPSDKSVQLDDKLRGKIVDVSFQTESGITVPGRLHIGDEPKEVQEGDDRMWIWHEYVSDDNEDIRVREALTKNINYNHLTIVQHNPLGMIRNRAMAGGKEMRHHGLPLATQLPIHNQAQGFSSTIELMGKAYHMLEGTQMIVDRAVTDDLSMTDMDHVGIEDVPFYRDSLEFYFEDPKLPTVLAYRGTMSKIAKRLAVDNLWVVDETFTDESVNFYCETPTGQGMAFRARSDNWNEMLASDNETLEHLDGSIRFSDEEWHNLRALFRLCIKVLAYSSIPRLSPVPTAKSDTDGRKAKFRTASPGVNGRPSRESVRVVYLPELAKETKSSNDLTNRKHAFKGRRGTLRYYKHERYVNMQGKYQYIPPIPGPNGEMPKAIYKVRK